MNPKSINRLMAEKVMGFTPYTDTQGRLMWEHFWPNSSSRDYYVDVDKYRPAFDLQQAVDGCTDYFFLKHWKGGWSCGPISDDWAITAKIPALAVCGMRLRMAGVTDKELA